MTQILLFLSKSWKYSFPFCWLLLCFMNKKKWQRINAKWEGGNVATQLLGGKIIKDWSFKSIYRYISFYPYLFSVNSRDFFLFTKNVETNWWLFVKNTCLKGMEEELRLQHKWGFWEWSGDEEFISIRILKIITFNLFNFQSEIMFW